MSRALPLAYPRHWSRLTMLASIAQAQDRCRWMGADNLGARIRLVAVAQTITPARRLAAPRVSGIGQMVAPATAHLPLAHL